MTPNSRHAVAVHILILLDLAGSEACTSEWLAGSVNTNPVVIRRVLGLLRRKGLVDSVPGQRGGYRLAKPSSDIDLWAVYDATQDGELFVKPRSEPNPRCPVGGSIGARLTSIYAQAAQATATVLRSVRIADLANEIRQTRGG